MILDIVNIMKKAIFLGELSNYKHKTNVDKVFVFETKIENSKSWIIARQYNNGHVILHSISDSENILNGLIKKT
ncbi:MAG: hypothetical protein ACI3Y0_07835 [Prevotella sp.]